MKREWILSAVVGLVCGGIWPAASRLVMAMDQGVVRLPTLLEAFITGAWLVWSMPGAVVDGRGYLTLAVITVFWVAAGAWATRGAQGLWIQWKKLRSERSLSQKDPQQDP